MHPLAPERFVRDTSGLDQRLVDVKLTACPHCGRVGALIGHGILWGYGEQGCHRVVRGRRFLCSNRFRRLGCGRTFSVLLAHVVRRFVIGTEGLSRLLDGVLAGLTRKAAWEASRRGQCLRSAYRLWSLMVCAQSAWRTFLSCRCPPPRCTDARPIAQVVAHMRCVLGAPACLLHAFQLTFQRGVLD